MAGAHRTVELVVQVPDRLSLLADGLGYVCLINDTVTMMQLTNG